MRMALLNDMDDVMIMFLNLFSKVFGTKNDREIKRMRKIVQQINAQALVALDDAELKAKTQAFRDRLAGGEREQLLVEALPCRGQ